MDSDDSNPLKTEIFDNGTIRPNCPNGIGWIDDYILERELGSGAFGSVYLVRDPKAKVKYAVKGLPPEVRHNSGELEKVLKNFRLVQTLSHPHIASLLFVMYPKQVTYLHEEDREKLRVAAGDPLVVMSYAPGITLEKWRETFPNKRVPHKQAAEIVRQIAEALDAAHEKRILHRDIKPSNVMIEIKEDGSINCQVLDFGLAAEIRSTMGRVSREIRDICGTRFYMAPEQWIGEKQGPATDQYALAVLYYELVKGEVPFQSIFDASDVAVMRYTVLNCKPNLSEIPAIARVAVRYALAKKPHHRFQTCTEFAQALNFKLSVFKKNIWLGWVLGGLGALAGMAALGWALGTASPKSITPPAPMPTPPNVTINPPMPPSAVNVVTNTITNIVSPTPPSVVNVVTNTITNIVPPKPPPAVNVVTNTITNIVPPTKLTPKSPVVDDEVLAGRVVFKIASQAKMEYKYIMDSLQEFRTVFAKEITELEIDYNAGNEAEEQKSYVVATNYFQKVLNQATNIKTLTTQYTEYQAVLTKVQTAQQAAEVVGAEKDLPRNFSVAQEKLAQVKQLAEQQQFQLAITNALSAIEIYHDLRYKVIESTLWDAKSKFSNKKFQECINIADKVLVWDADNAIAKKLKLDALEMLVPTLRLITKIGDREVEGAEAIIGDETRTTPIILEKLNEGSTVGGYHFKYTQGGRRYQGDAPIWTVDWLGVKVMKVNLVKVKYKAGDSKIIILPGGAKMEMVWCPPGEFMMGCPDGENGQSREKPQHKVKLTKGFWIGKYEVTQEQWKSVMNGDNPSYNKGDNYPVEYVSWSDCKRFCFKVGQGFGLPTEAQWEYACRAGKKTTYSWNNSCNGSQANCNGNYPYGTSQKGPYLKKTTPVGSYKPNAWGLYDMHGNVWEWCEDYYGSYSSGDAVNPVCVSGTNRVRRGGSWYDDASCCRSAYRFCYGSSNRYSNLGFRVVCSAGQHDY